MDPSGEEAAAPSSAAAARDGVAKSSSQPIENKMLTSVPVHATSPSALLQRRSRCRIVSRSADVDGADNFPMGCEFSPDGTCVLTATASDGKFRLYDTPFRYLSSGESSDKGCVDTADPGEGSDVAIGARAAVVPQHCEGVAAEGPVATYSHNQNNYPSAGQQNDDANESGDQRTDSRPRPWKASLTSHQGGPAPSSASASYAWYPLMTSSSPLTSLYATCRGHSMPIHLIDAYTSQLRASYRPYNGVDELEGPTVVSFSPDGRRVYGTGFRTDRTIAVFDTSIPGREGTVARLGKTRRSSDGQKGIPSAIAFPRSDRIGCSGPSNVFAVGAYSPASIYIYDDRMSSRFSPAGTIVLHGGLTVVGHGRAFSRKKRRFGQADAHEGGNEDDSSSLFSSARVNWFQSRARGGVTQLMWAPPASSNPYVLFSASRRSSAVLSWDVRTLSGGDGRPVCGLRSYARDGDTNQRLEFDIDDTGTSLFVGTGSSEGVVKAYDVNSGALDDTLNVTGSGDDGVVSRRDAVNGVSYFRQPTTGSGLLAVAVGSRRYDEQDSDDESECRAKPCPGLLQVYSLQ